MLEHPSIQCADVAVSAAFYDAVLVAVGGQRILEFDGPTIGYGVPPMPDFWIGPNMTGDDFRESHIAFNAPDRAAVDSFFTGVSLLEPSYSTNRGCGLSTTPITTVRLFMTRTATTLKPCAIGLPSRGRPVHPRHPRHP